jgi:hypothetical protein
LYEGFFGFSYAVMPIILHEACQTMQITINEIYTKQFQKNQEKAECTLSGILMFEFGQSNMEMEYLFYKAQ